MRVSVSSTHWQFVTSACIASIIRIQYLVRVEESIDFTCKFYLQNLQNQILLKYRLDTEVESLIWSVIEPCTGIVCACLSTLRPLFRTVFGGGYLSRGSGASRNDFPLCGLGQKTDSSGSAKSSCKWPYHKQQALSTKGISVKLEV